MDDWVLRFFVIRQFYGNYTSAPRFTTVCISNFGRHLNPPDRNLPTQAGPPYLSPNRTLYSLIPNLIVTYVIGYVTSKIY